MILDTISHVFVKKLSLVWIVQPESNLSWSTLKAMVAGLEYEAMDRDRNKARKPVAVSAIQSSVNAVNVAHRPSTEADKSLEQIVNFAQNSLLTTQKLAENMQQMMEKMQRPNIRRRDPATVTCFGCNEKGHYRSNCPKREQVERE